MLDYDIGTIIILIILWFIWLKQVFIYINRKLESYSMNKYKQSSQLSVHTILNMPVIQVLTQNKLPLSQKQSATNGQQKSQFITYVWTILLTIIITVILPCLLLFSDSNQFNQTLSQLISLVRQSKQLNHSQTIIYSNDLTNKILVGQLIGSLAFVVNFMKKINHNHQAKSKRSKCFQLTLSVIMIAVNPYLISIYVLQAIVSIFNYQKHTQSDILINWSPSKILKLLAPLILLVFIWCIINQQHSLLGQYYKHLIFPTTFLPHANIMWIFYSHMFDRYLLMYQLIFFLLPISTTVPLSLLKINHQTKLLIQYFMIVFTSYQCSYLNVYLFWFICLIGLSNFSSYNNPMLIKINKSLGFVAFIGSTFFFFCYERLTQMYLTSWMVNVGYSFVFGCVAWTLIAIWLAQLIRIEMEQVGEILYQQNEDNIFQKIISKIKGFFKIKLWTNSQPNQSNNQKNE